MKKVIIIIVVAIFAFGCKTQIQLFDTDSTNTDLQNRYHVFENDSLKITYNFWADMGVMSFGILNKLDVPIFIDWKKSSYIDNSVKLDYWIEELSTKFEEYYGSYFYKGPQPKPTYASEINQISELNNIVKVERITFIPPSSNYYRAQFYILPIYYLELENYGILKEVNRPDNPKKKMKVWERTFSKEDSPLVFSLNYS